MGYYGIFQYICRDKVPYIIIVNYSIFESKRNFFNPAGKLAGLIIYKPACLYFKDFLYLRYLKFKGMDFFVGMVFGAVIAACASCKSVRDGFVDLFVGIWEKITGK